VKHLCSKRMIDRAVSYKISRKPSQAMGADTAQSAQVSEFSNDKFSWFFHAKADQTFTVTLGGSRTRIDIEDTKNAPSVTSTGQEETYTTKRRRLEHPPGALDERPSYGARNVAAGSIEPERLGSEIRPTGSAGQTERASDSLPQSHDGSLAASLVDNEKSTVHIGRRLHPGNVEYVEYVMAKQPEYWSVWRSYTKRQLIVDDIANRFNFQHDGVPLDPKRIQEKICKALRNKQLGGGERRVNGNSEERFRKCSQNGISEYARRSNSSASLEQSSLDGSSSQRSGVTQNEKPTVHLGQRCNPGNVEYVEFVMAKETEYFQSDVTERPAIVRDIANRFIFKRDGVALDTDWINEKIGKAFRIKRRGGERRINGGRGELDKTVMATEKVVCDKRTTQGDTGVVESFAAEPHPPLPHRNVEPTALPPDIILMEKPIVRFGTSWRDSPSNRMYRESLYAAHKMHEMANSEQRESIIDTRMKQYEFQRRVSAGRDVWKKAAVEWARAKIAKSFEILDSRQERQVLHSTADCDANPHSRVTHGNNEESLMTQNHQENEANIVSFAKKDMLNIVQIEFSRIEWTR
jgi:hypothetical protein